MRTFAVLMLTLATSGCLAFGNSDDGCRFTAERNATLSVGTANQAKVISRAGMLRVQGQPAITDLRIRGKACASKQDLLDQIQLVAEERGGTLYIEAKLPESAGWLGDTHASLGLEIEAPESLMFDIEDGSGSVNVRGVGAVRLRDDSGSIEIEKVAGDVFVQDGAGGIQVKSITGSVEIKDGSGGLSVSGVTGNVVIHDGSGGLSVTDVEGGVEIDDGSGGIQVSRVTGDVTVTRDGSGRISVSHVQGNFTVERDGSGRVRYDDVSGRVSVSD